MKEVIGAQFYACGARELPERISVNGGVYRFVRQFKHDFFAATGLYELNDRDGSGHHGNPRKVVLKLSRQQNVFGLPMRWLGAGICEHEARNLRRLRDVKQVPKLLGRYGECGLIYEFMEGCELGKAAELPDDFFEKLRVLLKELHRRNVAYLDLNKRDNILVGEDGNPRLIDFQISFHAPQNAFLQGVWQRLLNVGKKADLYHLYKLKRKLQPQRLTEQERAMSRYRSPAIRLHRIIATPLRRLRRKLMAFLCRRGYLFREGRES
jgi:hypothetical protein